MKLSAFLTTTLVALLLIQKAFSANYTVTNKTPYKISPQQHINAGDTIFLDTSRTIDLWIDRLVGTPEKPIVIINKGGLVQINMGTVNMRISRCHHLKITGTGDPKLTYGIKLSNSTVMSISIEQFSDNVEVDHVEITGSGFSGITAKTDNYLDVSMNDEDRSFVMKNIHLHHNYIHHLKGGEGLYLGHNAWSKDPQSKPQHDIVGINIHHNKFEFTPREAIQVGACPSGNNRIHHNIIKHYGKTYIDSLTFENQPDLAQNNGIQLGQGFTGDCYNNWVETGSGKAMQLVGVYGANVYNNIIIKPDSWAFYVGNGRMVIKENGIINIIHNTIISPGREAIKFDPMKDSVIGNFYNNLIFNAKGIKDPDGKSGMFTKEMQLKTYNILENDSTKIKFTNLASNNFQLRKGSSAIQKAYDTSKSPVNFLPDFDYTCEVEKKKALATKRKDVGAYEFSMK